MSWKKKSGKGLEINLPFQRMESMSNLLLISVTLMIRIRLSKIENGGEGIGLFRTEFLYMERDSLPTEDEQFDTYKMVLERIGRENPVVVRTLDNGGDKHVDYLELPEELNPFLGVRAIRFSLDKGSIFRLNYEHYCARVSVYCINSRNKNSPVSEDREPPS